ncbi:sensor domain-containing diguanylate cyclase [Aquipseudomonas guryensis]|jgi:diguanylate cyclase|uniref:diguanylate cyclase n=1 Tax=Aquipseudomonas guryensis TaxID=2759165 RepID=A0A7W4DED0_9GAMM|nr:diguanylate cyclase [Pseudomonas guryensis]MBB1520732.1 GGDEF domain-containing protein [Pseudomonas guryensis]
MRLLLILLFSWLSCGVVQAGPIEGDWLLRLDEKNPRVELNAYFEYLADPGSLTDVYGVHALPAEAFTRHSSDVPNFGFTERRYWFRTQLLQVSGDESWFLQFDYSPLDNIDVYLLDQHGEMLVAEHGGDRRPFDQRLIKSRQFTVELPLSLDEPVWLYVAVQTEGSLQVPAILFSAPHYVAKSRSEYYMLGLYYGVLLSMLLYTLLTYLSVRDASHLYYIAYIAAYLLFQLTLNGLAFEYLWPQFPDWNNRMLPLSITVATLTLILLTRSFLQTRTLVPRIDKLLLLVQWLYVALALACLVMPYDWAIRLSTASVVLTPLVVFAVAVWIFLAGYRQSRFFLLAFTVLLLGMVLYALKTFHVLPGTYLTEYALQIGSALQMILLVFALADRLRLLKQENLRIEQEARSLLEQRVLERTEALNSALQELAVKNRQLSELSTLDGLTGVYNRAYQEEILVTEWARACRQKGPLSVLMVDIDHFKRINDNHGHQAGDAVLRTVAALIKSFAKRKADVVCRYGGEEFMVILPDTTVEGALAVAEGIRQALAELDIALPGGAIRITASIGLASVIPDSAARDKLVALVGAADEALYQAKEAGRNQVRQGYLPGTA